MQDVCRFKYMQQGQGNVCKIGNDSVRIRGGDLVSRLSGVLDRYRDHQTYQTTLRTSEPCCSRLSRWSGYCCITVFRPISGLSCELLFQRSDDKSHVGALYQLQAMLGRWIAGIGDNPTGRGEPLQARL